MANFTTTTTDDIYPTYFDSEETPCNLESVRMFLKTFVPITFSFIFVFGLVGNILVVITFSCYKKSKNMTDIYLLNMAVADILFIFTLPFWAAYYYYDKWIFEDFMCKLVRSIYAINFNCSMLLLACVGIDRYVAIVQVTKSFRLRTMALAYKRVLCFSVWIISVILSALTYIFSACYIVNENRLVCEAKYPQYLQASNWKFAVIIVRVSVGFLIPFLVMVFCYVSIIKTLLQAKNSQRHKAINVVVTVVIVFLVCQLPYNVLLLRKAETLSKQKSNCQENKNDTYALFITETLAFFHCCLNPVIYAFIGVKFRNYFLKIMQDLWCFKKVCMPRTHRSRASSDIYSSRKTSEVSVSEVGSSFAM